MCAYHIFILLVTLFATSRNITSRLMQAPILLKHGLLSVSSICRGEVFTAYLLKHPHHPILTKQSQIYKKCDSAWLLPAGIRNYVDYLSAYVGSLDNVLDNNTLALGFSRFLSREDGQTVRRYHTGEIESRISAIVGLTKCGRTGRNWSPGICLECLNEDICATGEVFWRRDFLLNNVRWCARHQTPIHNFCDSCLYITQRKLFYAPADRCVCGHPLNTRTRISNFEELELELSRGWTKMLDPTFAPHLRGPEIAALTRDTATELGLAKNCRVKWKHFRTFLGQPKLKAFGESIGFKIYAEYNWKAISGERSIRDPFHALFLLIAMLGSWDAVEDAIKSRPQYPHTSPESQSRAPSTILRKTDPSTQERTKALSIALLPETSRLYSRLRDENPELNHSSIKRLLPTLHSRAINRDALRAHGVAVKPTIWEKEDTAAKDAEAAAYIERRWHELTTAGTTRRLTKHLLLWGSPFGQILQRPATLTRLPLMSAALRKYTETSAMRYRRLLRMEILSGNFPRVAPKDVDSIDGLSDKKIESIMRRHQYLKTKKK